MGIANIINNSTTTSGGEIIRELVNASDGAGLHFDGSGSIDGTSNLALGSKYSAEFVVNYTGSDGNRLFDVSGDTRFIVEFNRTGFTGKIAGYDSAYYEICDIPDNDVFHLVVTVDGSAVSAYINGNLAGTATKNNSTSIDTVTQWAIGANRTGSGSEFEGTIYRARFWNKVVDAKALFERADVDFADQYGSQTEKITAWTNNSSYPYETFTSSGTTISSAINTSGYGIAYSAITLEAGKKYRITYDITLNSGTRPKIRVGSASTSLGTSGVVLDTDATGSHEFTATSSATKYAGFWTDDGDANNWSVANFSFVQIGCVTDYDLAYAQPALSTLIQDRSNAADGVASSTGVTQVQPITQLNSTSARIGSTQLAAGTSPYIPADGELMVSGNVLIGSGTPASLVSGGDSPVLSIGGTDSVLVTDDKAGAISFITSDPSYTDTYSDGICGEITSIAETGTGAAYGLAFHTATTTSSNRAERMRISSTGICTFNAGIAFSQDNSSTAGSILTTLDHYEQGHFTATLNGGTAEPATLLTSNANYTRVGDRVFFSIGFENADTTGYSGTITISGLPFANAGVVRAPISVITYDSATWTSGTQAAAFVGRNHSYVSMYAFSSGGVWNALQHDAGTGRYFWLNGTYRTAAA